MVACSGNDPKVEKYVTALVAYFLVQVVAVTLVIGCICMGAKREVPVCLVYGTVNERLSMVVACAVFVVVVWMDVCGVGATESLYV